MVVTIHAIDYFIPQFSCPTHAHQVSKSLIPPSAQLKSCHRNTSRGRSDKTT